MRERGMEEWRGKKEEEEERIHTHTHIVNDHILYFHLTRRRVVTQ